MIIGEAGAVGGALGRRPARAARGPREDRPGQPVYAIDGRRRRRATPGCAPRPRTISSVCCRRAPRRTSSSSGIDPLARDPDGFRWRTLAQIEEGRSWLWLEDGVVLFKAEASAWTPAAVQLQQVWVDPAARGPRLRARAACATCAGCCSRGRRRSTLFVRRENTPAIALYDAVGMRRVLEYRSVLF